MNKELKNADFSSPMNRVNSLILQLNCGAQPDRDIPLGALHPMDDLFNALHGVGDVSFEAKCLTMVVIHDELAETPEFADAVNPQIQAEVRRIVMAALQNKPQVAFQVLDRWLAEVKQGIEDEARAQEGG